MQTSSATVKGHRITVVALDVALNAYQCACSCGYLGMVRKSGKVAVDDIERHAYTVKRDT
jgi:hypothetical protein